MMKEKNDLDKIKKFFSNLKRKYHKKIWYNAVIFKEPKVIYFQIDRTGSNSLFNALKESFKKKKKILREHYTKRNYKKYKNYFKFAIVRNPFDRLVSIYNYPSIEFNKNISFKDFIKMIAKTNDNICDEKNYNMHKSQYCHITKDNKLIVDYIGKFENLEEEYKNLCEKFGVKVIKLPHINKSRRKNYREYYDKELIELVKKRYKKDLKIFDYKF